MRKSIIDTLKRFEAENAVLGAKCDIEFMRLRKSLVEKYGEEGVSKVEQKIKRDMSK